MASLTAKDYSCSINDVLGRIASIDPKAYGKSRNYLDGAVTWLSPFLTHGITTTPEIARSVLESHRPKDCYKLLYELAWREYFHRVWQMRGEGIFKDLLRSQPGVINRALPTAVIKATTGIEVIDHALMQLYSEGLMHNHARMWLAGIVCNLGRTHWYEAARWLHYHLLDGDLASNTLSWQWIAGTFSHKQYIANQDNINKYSRTSQTGTWLDLPYPELAEQGIPDVLTNRTVQAIESNAPAIPGSAIGSVSGEIALRSIWQLDPRWQPEVEQQIVFVDTELHTRWPLSPQRWAMIEHWAVSSGSVLHFGTIDSLRQAVDGATVLREESPACRDWPGTVVERQWLYPMPEREFGSFSQFWKQVRSSIGL